MFYMPAKCHFCGFVDNSLNFSGGYICLRCLREKFENKKKMPKMSIENTKNKTQIKSFKEREHKLSNEAYENFSPMHKRVEKMMIDIYLRSKED